jgi:hypothetical protein
MTGPVTEFVAGMICLEHTNLARAGSALVLFVALRIFETPDFTSFPRPRYRSSEHTFIKPLLIININL